MGRVAKSTQYVEDVEDMKEIDNGRQNAEMVRSNSEIKEAWSK